MPSQEAAASEAHDEGASHSPDDNISRMEDLQHNRNSQIGGFFLEVNAIIERLQRCGRIDGAPIAQAAMRPRVLEGLHQDGRSKIFSFNEPAPKTLSFTLWWRDSAGQPQALDDRDATPPEDSIPVFVQVYFYDDYATLSFYIDVSRTFQKSQLLHGEKRIYGERRKQIVDMIALIRRTAAEQISTQAVNDAPLPEPPGAVSASLSDAADYLYKGVWAEFARDFGLNFEPDGAMDLKTGKICLNTNGLLLAVSGLRTPEDERREATKAKLRTLNGMEERAAPAFDLAQPSVDTAHDCFGPADLFDAKVGEPATVLKSFRPLLRRVVHGADRRDWVGCGILELKALLASPLGSRDVDYPDDLAAATNVPAAFGVPHDCRHCPTCGGCEAEAACADCQAEKSIALCAACGKRHGCDACNRCPKCQYKEPTPFLILTKGEPNREQIGRFVERFLALETLRTVALRQVNVIRNAGVHLELISRKLNELRTYWNVARDEIWKRADQQTLKLNKPGRKKKFANFQELLTKMTVKGSLMDVLTGSGVSALNRKATEVVDTYFRDLSGLNANIENKLIEAGIEIEHAAPGGAGVLLSAILRTNFYADKFKGLQKFLEVENVDGWVNYEQFSARGMSPIFDTIKNTGQRLSSAQNDLKLLTDVIQASALIGQNHATRRNTEALKYFGGLALSRTAAMVGLVVYLAFWLAGLALNSALYNICLNFPSLPTSVCSYVEIESAEVPSASSGSAAETPARAPQPAEAPN